MIGQKPTLRDIVLAETADVCDLHCYEEMPPEEEEEFLFLVTTDCCLCDNTCELELFATRATIRELEVLLLEKLRTVCPTCSTHHH